MPPSGISVKKSVGARIRAAHVDGGAKNERRTDVASTRASEWDREERSDERVWDTIIKKSRRVWGTRTPPAERRKAALRRCFALHSDRISTKKAAARGGTGDC